MDSVCRGLDDKVGMASTRLTSVADKALAKYGVEKPFRRAGFRVSTWLHRSGEKRVGGIRRVWFLSDSCEIFHILYARGTCAGHRFVPTRRHEQRQNWGLVQGIDFVFCDMPSEREFLSTCNVKLSHINSHRRSVCVRRVLGIDCVLDAPEFIDQVRVPQNARDVEAETR